LFLFVLGPMACLFILFIVFCLIDLMYPPTRIKLTAS
jgi:hypothetical protein